MEDSTSDILVNPNTRRATHLLHTYLYRLVWRLLNQDISGNQTALACKCEIKVQQAHIGTTVTVNTFSWMIS